MSEFLRFSLSLTHAAADGEAAAWFIPGSDCAAWLEELVCWNTPLDAARLLVLPISRRDVTPRGVLVVLPAGAKPTPGARVRAYARRAGRLYLPADAALDPEVTDAELSSALAADLAVLHPAVGLVGFAKDEWLPVAALLAAPPERDCDWDRAEPGEAIRDRIESVSPLSPPSVEIIFQSGREDIGQSPVDQLPGQSRAGARIGDMLRAVGRWLAGQSSGEQRPSPERSPQRGSSGGSGSSAPGFLQRWFAQIASALASAGAAAGGSQWGRKLRNLAKRAMPNLQSLRMQQLEELMRMLDADPEKGLKFALPLAGDAHRGAGEPGASLSQRDVNFDLGRALGGGGQPGGTWFAPTEIYQGLHQRYRALADREMRLGRFKRAAYIFAELLADYASAVSALKQGKHFREAAIVLRDRLKNPLDAAKCFLDGGLIQEAVALYEDYKHYEMAGDLWLRLERPDQAEHCYRRAVEVFLQADNLLSAAQLLERKIGQPDEALAVLAGGWPPRAVCLKSQFELLGRLGRHEAAATLIGEQVRQSSPAAYYDVALAGTLAELVESYPDHPTRMLSADATRRVASRALSQTAVPADLETLVQAVVSLAPQDRLLSRDGRRFVEQRSAKPSQSASSGRQRQAGTVWCERRFQLLPGIAWATAATTGSTLYAAGYAQQGMTVVLRCGWNAPFDWIEWSNVPALDAAGRISVARTGRTTTVTPLDPNLPDLDAMAAGRSSLLLTVGWGGVREHVLLPVGSTLPVQAFTQTAPGSPEQIGVPAWFPPGVIGCEFHETGALWILRVMESGPVVLSLYATNGTLISTRGLFDAAGEPRDELDEFTEADVAETTWDLSTHLTGREALPMASRWGTAFVALGETLVSIRPGTAPRNLRLPRRITSLSASFAETTGRRLIATFEHGAVVLLADTLEIETTILQGASVLAAGFTRDGRLVAVGEGTAEISEPNDPRRWSEWTPQKHDTLLPVVLSTETASGFALVSQSGQVWRYRA